MERNRRSGYPGSYFHHLLKKFMRIKTRVVHGVESAWPRSKGMDARDFEKAAVMWTRKRQHERYGKRDGGEEVWRGGAWRIVVPQGGEMRAVPEWRGTGRQVSGSTLHQDAGAALRGTAQKEGGARSEAQKRGRVGDTELRATQMGVVTVGVTEAEAKWWMRALEKEVCKRRKDSSE